MLAKLFKREWLPFQPSYNINLMGVHKKEKKDFGKAKIATHQSLAAQIHTFKPMIFSIIKQPYPV